MHVLHVNASLDPVTGGGTAARTSSLCRALSSSGTRTSVLTLGIGLDPGVAAATGDTEIIALRCLNRRFYVPEPAPARVRAAVASADIVHLSGHWTVLNAMVYRAARRHGTPHVVTPAGALPIYGRSTRIKHSYNRLVGSAMVRTAAAHIAITRDEVSDFVPYGVPPRSVTVIPNGVSPQEFGPPLQTADAELSARLGHDPRPYILFMGRLNPIKGPDLLLAAIARVRDQLGDLRVVLAGPDEGMAAHLRDQARAAGLSDRVAFLGSVQGAVKVAAYRRARLLVVPSRHEAMSLVALEAGASATPVLLTDVCGFPEVEKAGGGRVVPATVEGLSDGLRELLLRPEQWPQMGRSLQRLVNSDYSWERAAASHRELYRSLVDRRQGQPPTVHGQA